LKDPKRLDIANFLRVNVEHKVPNVVQNPEKPNSNVRIEVEGSESSKVKNRVKEDVNDVEAQQHQNGQYQQLPEYNKGCMYRDLGRYPFQTKCPFCEREMMTDTDLQYDSTTWIAALVLCIVCCPISWLPFCLPSCQSVHHYCSRCQRKIGSTEPMINL
jgi:LITAF-like zinc ribbon domain